ncbi:hypothetical protein B0H13DRAFT_2320159 [Mycena leptocephala]|nr:hypothetical protein B0H13DRAFT_2320159 [Mycena leptocephala]
MASFRTISITSEKRPSNVKRLSLASLASFASIDSGSNSVESPIVVSTTVSTTTTTYPMTVPPPFATSLGSDERLPRPQRGAPPVAPAKTAEERKQQLHHGVAHTLRRAIGLERTRLDPALCEGWWYISKSFDLRKRTIAHHLANIAVHINIANVLY